MNKVKPFKQFCSLLKLYTKIFQLNESNIHTLTSIWHLYSGPCDIERNRIPKSDLKPSNQTWSSITYNMIKIIK